jgi:hypothetical protein
MSGLWSSKKNSEILILFLLIGLALFFRLLHFGDTFNFSSDQGAFSITALEQWQGQELALIGPPLSFHIGDKAIYLGPLNFYLQTIFLLLGGWDPQLASVWFTIFSCLMMVPLFYGSKSLLSQKAAFFLCLIYALNPFYILYTKFLWNPNFQFALSPLLIYAMGLYQTKSSKKVLFFVGLMLGFLLQLHYQFFLVLVGIWVYYIFWKKISLTQFIVIFLGIVFTFAPFIYYEFTHKFLNLNNLFFFITHRDILYYQNKDQSSFAPHYYLTLSFFILLFLISLFRQKISAKLITVLSGLLIVVSAFYFFPLSQGAYGMAENWNYQNEAKVHQIVRDQQLDEFNLTNLEYDSLYHVQKYLLKKDQIKIDDNNYYDNKYLFVVSKKPDLFSYPAYEIQSFKSSKLINQWPINSSYNLYLLERTN